VSSACAQSALRVRSVAPRHVTRLTLAPSASAVRATPSTCDTAEFHELTRLAASLYAGFAVAGKVFRDFECTARGGGLSHHPHALTLHVRSGDIFSNWRDGKHVTTHAGFQHEGFGRGQPPLSFYTTAAAHATPGTNGSLIRLYDRISVATSPDRSNPVVHEMLRRADSSAVSDVFGLPLTLASTESFADDLAHLLCSRNLVLADSSLNAMLTDSPNLRNVYTFSPTSCGRPVPCSPHADGGAAGGRTGARGAGESSTDRLTGHAGQRHWCIAPEATAGNYTVAVRWENTEAQRHEMLHYGRHGGMAPPILVGGAPLSCK